MATYRFGFTFPLGVLALASFQLGSLLGSVTFNVIGAMLTVALFLIWSYSFFRTVMGAINGSVFADPSLGELGKKL